MSGGVGDGAVQELLREAEDDLLLKLSVSSHTTSSTSALDPDLARRFEALKSPPPPSSSPSKLTAPRRSGGGGVEVGAGRADEEWRRVLGDDLAARFAALKGSLGRSSGPQEASAVPKINDSDDDDDGGGDGGGGGEGDGISKEVEKVMQWAMDAARLDPSRSDDDDDDDAQEAEEEEEQEQEDLEVKKNVREESSKGKRKPRNWFFFWT